MGIRDWLDRLLRPQQADAGQARRDEPPTVTDRLSEGADIEAARLTGEGSMDDVERLGDAE
jgi:hypothetical protein